MSSGPSRRVLCINKSEIACQTPFPFVDNASEVQGERRAELVRALLSRSLHSPLQLVCIGKIRHKKGVHETTTCTPVGISVGSVEISVGIIFSAAPQRHFCTLQPVAAHGPWHRSVPTCSQAYA